MKFLVTLSIRPDASAAEIEQQRIPSSKVLWDMHLAGVIREMYARQDNAGVVFIAESPDSRSPGRYGLRPRRARGATSQAG